MTASVTMDVLARDRASATLNKVGSSAEHNSGMLRHFGASLAGVFTGAAIYEGAEKAIDFLKESGEVAAENEHSMAGLALQLKTSAGARRVDIGSVEDWINAQGRAYGVTENDLQPALARAVTATHNVAQAESLVSEAMDVSAGKRKSLASVTEALSRGEQGNLTGLARLGVATKDASGKTLTFDQINKNLAATFKGQAATAAATTAGQYDILHARVQQLQIQLGDHLLPIGLDVAKWMLDKAIPAGEQLASTLDEKLTPDVQALSHWFSENKDSLEQFVETAGKDALEVLEELAHITGTAVGIFEQLPGPVQRSAAVFAIASFAINDLRKSLAGVSFTKFIGDLGQAETRTAALTSAAKTAAGAAGIALLIQSANEGSGALSTLESTAGAAAAGFSVAGPWGAAVGGAAGLVYNLGKKLDGTRSDAELMYLELGRTGTIQQAVKSLDDLKGTLDQVSGAYTGATRAAVLKKLNDDGLTATAATLGISQRELVNLALGQKGAMSALLPIVNSYKGQMSSLDTQIKAVQESSSSYYTVQDRNGIKTTQLTQAAFDQINTLKGQKAQLQGNLVELQKMPGVLDQDAKAIQASAAATADYTGKLKGIPPIVRSEIEADGLAPTAKAIADLSSAYNLTPKQVNTLIKATGADTSAKQVQTLIDKINALHDKYVTVHYNYVGLGSKGGSGPTRDGTGGYSGRTAGVGGTSTPLAYTLRGMGANPDGSPNGDGTKITKAAEHLLESAVPGLKSGQVKLDSALSAVDKMLSTRKQHLSDVLNQYQALQSGFSGFTSSIFSTLGQTDADGNQLPASLQDILSQSAGNAASASSLNADVQRLISEGLNQTLLQQLESSGASGAANIHTLATQASLSDIANLNSNQSLTDQQLSAAGTAVANVIEGPAKAQAEAAEKQARTLDQILKALQEGSQTVEISIDGDTIIKAIAKKKKHHPDS